MSARWKVAPWLAALVVVTVALLLARHSLDKAHIALAYLVLVLGASSRAGRVPGLVLAIVAFFSFNFFFVPPYHTLVVAEPLDWLVLVAFLGTGTVAAQLLSRAQNEASAARERAAEVEHLSAVGTEALNAGRAEDALTTIAALVRTTLGVGRCEIFLLDEPAGATRLAAASGDEALAVEDLQPRGEDHSSPREFAPPAEMTLVEWVAAAGRAVFVRADGSTRVSPEAAGEAAVRDLDLGPARSLLLPLRVGGRMAGVLRLASADMLALDAPRRRFLEALSYYAALGAERVRLAAQADHADALRQADALKDALLASVSHDLRTPLTTIKALAQEIRAEGDDRAATIEEEADRLNRFVADLLDLSRLSGGALTVSPEVNAAEDLVGTALQQISGASAGREVRVEIAEPLLLGRFDFSHALRIVVNLLENALKYSDGPAPVDVAVRRSGAWLEIAVSDRGAGVPAEDRERIFEAFYRRPRGGGRSASDVGSAGLGLSIARQLADAQGGELFHEPREGGGSSFILRLPAVDMAELSERSL